VGSWEDHLPRLNTNWRPIVNKYREEKVKSSPRGRLKVPETLCLQAVEVLSWDDRVAFVESSGELFRVARLKHRNVGAEAKASLKWAFSCSE